MYISMQILISLLIFDLSLLKEDYKEPNGVRNCQDERNHVTLEFHKQSPTAPLEKVELDVNPLLYGMDDKPPWYMCLTLGLQVNT